MARGTNPAWHSPLPLPQRCTEPALGRECDEYEKSGGAVAQSVGQLASPELPQTTTPSYRETNEPVQPQLQHGIQKGQPVSSSTRHSSGAQDSSPHLSNYLISSQKMSRVFQVTKPVFKHDYQIIPEGEKPLYKVKNSPFPRGGTPDLALLDGLDKTAPVLIVCHMPKFSRHFKIGFGDPADPESITWEDFIKPKVGGSERRISVSFASDGTICETGQGQREEFIWKRTHHVGVQGKKLHRGRLRNRKLIDERGDIVAVFTFDKTGWLQINVDRGRDFDVMVMMTLLSIIEWMRRQ